MSVDPGVYHESVSLGPQTCLQGLGTEADQVVIDAAAGERRANDYLRDAGYMGTVTINGSVASVTVQHQQSTSLLGLIGFESVTVHAECVPCSTTRPSASTTTRSASLTVDNRCATMIVVRPAALAGAVVAATMTTGRPRLRF